MKATRSLSVLMATLLAAGLLAGCGGAQSSSAPSATDLSSQPDASESRPAETDAADTGIPGYINLDSALPIVKDGQNIPMKIGVTQGPDYGNAEDLYWTHFIRERMNIDVEIEQIQTQSLEEYIQLAFVAGTYPEVMLNMQMNTQRQVSFGMMEKQLLPLNPYINSELMPNLSAAYEERPDFKALVTAPDGNIYSYGCFYDTIESAGVTKAASINTDWLKEFDLDFPRTLDEFIEMLRAFKTKGGNVVPAAGSLTLYHPGGMILNALGYVTADDQGLTPALRNGKTVIPAGDREAYGEYLRVMKLLYSEGLISPDFYTMDDMTVKAMIADGRSGYANQNAMYSIFPAYEQYSKWEVAYPMTSELNATPLALKRPELNTGGMVITDACRHPEAAARFADYFFTAEGAWHTWAGPTVGTDQMMEGWGGCYIDEEYKTRMVDIDENPGMYASVFDYLVKKVSLSGASVIGDRREESGYKYPANGLTVTKLSDTYRPEVPDNYYRMYVLERVAPVTQDGYPTLTFFTEEENIRLTDLRSVLEAHMQEESAKFVTGVRSLDELDRYFEELDGLGFQEYLAIYENGYQVYLNNLK